MEKCREEFNAQAFKNISREETLRIHVKLVDVLLSHPEFNNNKKINNFYLDQFVFSSKSLPKNIFDHYNNS